MITPYNRKTHYADANFLSIGDKKHGIYGGCFKYDNMELLYKFIIQYRKQSQKYCFV